MAAVFGEEGHDVALGYIWEAPHQILGG